MSSTVLAKLVLFQILFRAHLSRFCSGTSDPPQREPQVIPFARLSPYFHAIAVTVGAFFLTPTNTYNPSS